MGNQQERLTRKNIGDWLKSEKKERDTYECEESVVCKKRHKLRQREKQTDRSVIFFPKTCNIQIVGKNKKTDRTIRAIGNEHQRSEVESKEVKWKIKWN